jgi:transposase
MPRANAQTHRQQLLRLQPALLARLFHAAKTSSHPLFTHKFVGRTRYHNEDQKRSFKNAWFDRGSDVLRDTAQLRQTGKAGIARDIEQACQRFDFHGAVDLIDAELQSAAIANIPHQQPDERQKAISIILRPEVTQAQAANMFSVNEKTIRNWEENPNKAPPEYVGRGNRGKLEVQAKIFKSQKEERARIRKMNRLDARDYNRQDEEEPTNFNSELDRLAWKEERDRKITGK